MDDALRTLTRRNLMKGGLASVALLAAAGAGLALRPSALGAAPRGPLQVLDRRSYAILAAAAERLCPPRAPGVPSASDLDVAGKADAVLARADADVREGLVVALSVLESALAGALFGERATPFTQLAPEAQDRILLAHRDSDVAVRRALFHGLSGLLASIYYGEPASHAAVGYPGPPDPRALRAAYADQLVDFGSLRAGATR